MSFRVSIVQQPLAWQDAAANRAHFAQVLAPLAGTTDLVVLPEMFTTGFTMKPEALRRSRRRRDARLAARAGARARCGRGRQRRGQRQRPLLQPLHARDAGRPDVLVRQAPPVPHGRRTPPLQRRRSRADRRMARRAAVSAGVLRPAFPGVEPAPARARIRPRRSTRPTGRRRGATRGRRCCARAPSRTRPSASA